MQAEVERNETVFWPNFPREVRPLSQCPGRCSARGMCTFLYTETARRPDIQPVCECYYGWQARLRESVHFLCTETTRCGVEIQPVSECYYGAPLIAAEPGATC